MQIGYARVRVEGFFGYHETYYTEMSTPLNWHKWLSCFSTFPAPQWPIEGSTHLYKIDNTQQGTWTYFVDGVDQMAYSDPYWASKPPDSVLFFGEGSNEADDIPGTAAFPARFRLCCVRYAGGTSYFPVHWTSLGAVILHDPGRDGRCSAYGNDGLNVWDAFPNP